MENTIHEISGPARPAKRKKAERYFFALLSAWVVLNLLQAGLTELDPDEAYYWMYSKELDWGFFDHPPLVAILIKIGYSLVHNELGVRLLSVLIQALSFYFIWLLLGKPLEKSRILTLFALLVAMPMLQIYGFVATPDGPLLFFAVLFFFAYERFVRSESRLNTAFLGFCMAALLYSKYHGILLIIFTLLSNLSLLRRPKFYLASLFGFLLFFPHLYWQYAHDFPSFRYHLKGRDDAYELKYTTTYLLNQLLIFNPFLLPMTFLVIWRRKIADKLERAFYFTIFGFWVFFFWMSFKGHVEPQWTAILTIPFVVLLYRHSLAHPGFNLWIKRLALFSLGLFLLARFAIVRNVFEIKSHFHHKKWVYELQEKADGRQVVFQNSYREASKYTFYSGAQAYTFTDIDYRRSQFDIWDWEKELQNKSVMIAAQKDIDCADCRIEQLSGMSKILIFADSLQITQKVEFILPSEALNWVAGAEISMPVSIHNPYAHDIFFDVGNMPLSVLGLFYIEAALQDSTTVKLDPEQRTIPAGKVLRCNAVFSVPENLPVGNYRFGIGLKTGVLPPAFNSKMKKVILEVKHH